MDIFAINKLQYFNDVDIIKDIYEKAIGLNIIVQNDLPRIPNKADEPISFYFFDQINSGAFRFRIESFTLTAFAKKKINSIFTMEDQGKFIEITNSSLNKDKTFTFCRSAKLKFNAQVQKFLCEFGKFYLYAIFDSFDLKTGTDIRQKIVVLSPDELDLFNNDFRTLKLWNESITQVNNTFSRLKYRISEIGLGKNQGTFS